MSHTTIRLQTVVSFICISYAFAPYDLLANDDEELAAYLVQGVRHERERIRSGTFKLEGTLTENRKGQDTITLEVEAICIFDFPNQSIRFDRSETWKRPNGGIDRLRPATREKYIRTPDESIHTSTPFNIVGRAPVDTAPVGELKPLDIRCAGLVEPHAFGYSLSQMLESWTEKMQLEEVENVAPGLYKLSYAVAKNNKIGWRVWVNEARGFTIERHETQMRGPKGWMPDWLAVIEATWENRGRDVWVPVSVSGSQWQEYGAYNFRFDWEELNGDVSPTIFTVEGMDLPKGTIVADSRLGGTPIVVGRIGEDPDAMPLPVERTGSGRMWLLFIVIGTIASLGGLAFMARRWRTNAA